MTLPRLLVIMGSGETAPTMKTPHRRVFERLEADGDRAMPVMLDTPFGFQENAPILAAATTKYFSDADGQGRRRGRTRLGPTPATRAAIEAAMTQHPRRELGVRRTRQPDLRPAPVAAHLAA